MAINPINPVYMVPQESYFEQFLPAAKLGQMALQSQEVRRQADLAAEVETRRRNAVSEFMSNPDPSMIDISRFLTQLPDDQAKALAPALSKIPDEKIQGKVRFGSQVMQALRSDPTVAVRLLQDQAKAEENSGKAQDAQFYRSIADDVTKNGPANAFRLTGALVGSLPGGKDAIAALAAAEEAQRKEITAPTEQKKLEAETKIREQESKAGVAPRTLSTEQGIMERVDGTWKPTGFTVPKGQQVSISLGEGQKGFENATTLRKEFNTESKPFLDINSAFGRMQQAHENSKSDKTGTSDLALIFAYMKMLDPGSTVREGEAASAANAGGVGERVLNLYNEIRSGKKLTQKVRDEFLTMGKRNYTKNQTEFNGLKKRYRGIADRAGIDPENVITQETIQPPANAPAIGTIEDGYRFKGGNPADPKNWEEVK
jgi:hypothetical protein